MRSVSLMLLLTATTLSVSACETSGPARGSFCDIAKPIYFQPDDQMTLATERAIIKHNEVGAALCRWQ